MRPEFHDLELETKPDFLQAMERVYAWFEGELLDRVPVRFSGHNEEFNIVDSTMKWESVRDRWFDVEYRVERFLENVRTKPFLGETFPVFWPNLGPNVLAAILGGELEFGDVTSWIHPFVSTEEQASQIGLNRNSPYYRKLRELTAYALERCSHQFMVGYTDMHPGLDCADAMVGTTELCLAMYDDPEFVTTLVERVHPAFLELMGEFHGVLHGAGQLSVTWMGIPSFETMHIPSCDLGVMISEETFQEFALPVIIRESREFRHNIFHVDGKGVARHVDALLDVDTIQAYQWVQGVGLDRPIMQSLDFIRKVQNKMRGVVVDLQTDELEPFIREMSPQGIYLSINESDVEVQRTILRRLESWR